MKEGLIFLVILYAFDVPKNQLKINVPSNFFADCAVQKYMRAKMFKTFVPKSVQVNVNKRDFV